MKVPQTLHTSIRRWGRQRLTPAQFGAIGRAAAFPFRGNLTMLASIYGSDKTNRHAYTEHYECHLGHLGRRRVRVLEIGIGGYETPQGGASLRMWRSYFRRSEVHGLDLHHKDISEPRITAHQGDQSDPEVLRRLGDAHGPFDVIIDDGSHVNRHIRASFAVLFPEYLRPGGWYVIEDMATAYLDEYGGGGVGTPATSVELVKDLVDDVNRTFWAGDGAAGRSPQAVRSIHVYEQIAFIAKSG
jgi:demethylmacrocin O-methyltransferase